MNFIRILLFIFFVILSPTFVYASGGGPLLLLFNSSVFIIGQIWIMGVEFIIYRKLVIVSKEEAFGDVFSANIFSTLVVAFGFSLIITFAGLVGSLLPGNIGQVLSAIGTWAYENSKYNRLALCMSLFWFVLSIVMTVYFEAWIYRRRWSKRGFYTNVSPAILAWYTNTISHIGLFVAILIVWHELI
jgi:hypothetical protein